MRSRLREYYAAEGRDDLLSVEVRKGSYAAVVTVRDAEKGLSQQLQPVAIVLQTAEVAAGTEAEARPWMPRVRTPKIETSEYVLDSGVLAGADPEFACGLAYLSDARQVKWKIVAADCSRAWCRRDH